jgi:DNA-binding beta-propeller fold protein YncE
VTPTSPAVPVAQLGVRHALQYPTRVAAGPQGRLYATDFRVGSVFIFDAKQRLVGELQGIPGPLGIAVAPDGTLFVGSKERQAVLAFDANGIPLRAIGEGDLKMPNDLALDRDGLLYVADSSSDRIAVYTVGGELRRTFGARGSGDGQLRFPSAVAVAYRAGHPDGELFVADQGNGRISVFSLAGAYLRSLGRPAEAFSGSWEGSFARLQSLAVDSRGRVHALDAYMNLAQVLDADTGAFLDSYGSYGKGAGQLNVPLALAIAPDGRVVVADSENQRLNLLLTVSPGEGG